MSVSLGISAGGKAIYATRARSDSSACSYTVKKHYWSPDESDDFIWTESLSLPFEVVVQKEPFALGETKKVFKVDLLILVRYSMLK
jgi:hypothetical protein